MDMSVSQLTLSECITQPPKLYTGYGTGHKRICFSNGCEFVPTRVDQVVCATSKCRNDMYYLKKELRIGVRKYKTRKKIMILPGESTKYCKGPLHHNQQLPTSYFSISPRTGKLFSLCDSCREYGVEHNTTAMLSPIKRAVRNGQKRRYWAEHPEYRVKQAMYNIKEDSRFTFFYLLTDYRLHIMVGVCMENNFWPRDTGNRGGNAGRLKKHWSSNPSYEVIETIAPHEFITDMYANKLEIILKMWYFDKRVRPEVTEVFRYSPDLLVELTECIRGYKT